MAPVKDVKEAYRELARLGKPVALRLFPEEGHFFEHDRALRMSWKLELAFYGRVWDFETDPSVPVDIENFEPEGA